MRNELTVIALSLVLSLYGSGLVAQEVMSSSGAYSVSNSGNSLSWTLGEPVSETARDRAEESILTQGFHQSHFILVYIGEKEKPELNVKIYPNPAADRLSIDLSGDVKPDMRYDIFDLQGRAVLSGRLHGTSNQVELNRLANAQYVLIIRSEQRDFRETYQIQKVK